MTISHGKRRSKMLSMIMAGSLLSALTTKTNFEIENPEPVAPKRKPTPAGQIKLDAAGAKRARKNAKRLKHNRSARP